MAVLARKKETQFKANPSTSLRACPELVEGAGLPNILVSLNWLDIISFSVIVIRRGGHKMPNGRSFDGEYLKWQME
jgi:hypothetical protein